MLSYSKDTDREILLKINSDRELLEMCSLNKYFNGLCDEAFFRNRIVAKYPQSLKNKPENMKWKQFYLKLVYLIGKMQEDYEFDFTSGDPEMYFDILEESNIAQQFFFASKYYLKDLLSYLISRENKIDNNWPYKNYLEWGVFGAAVGNHEELLEWYLKNVQPEISLDLPLSGAAEGGHKTLVENLIERGATDFNSAIYNAGRGGQKEIVGLLLKRGANINEALVGAAETRQPKEFVHYLLEIGGNIEQALLLYDTITTDEIAYLSNFL